MGGLATQVLRTVHVPGTSPLGVSVPGPPFSSNLTSQRPGPGMVSPPVSYQAKPSPNSNPKPNLSPALRLILNPTPKPNPNWNYNLMPKPNPNPNLNYNLMPKPNPNPNLDICFKPSLESNPKPNLSETHA